MECAAKFATRCPLEGIACIDGKVCETEAEIRVGAKACICTLIKVNLRYMYLKGCFGF